MHPPSDSADLNAYDEVPDQNGDMAELQRLLDSEAYQQAAPVFEAGLSYEEFADFARENAETIDQNWANRVLQHPEWFEYDDGGQTDPQKVLRWTR